MDVMTVNERSLMVVKLMFVQLRVLALTGNEEITQMKLISYNAMKLISYNATAIATSFNLSRVLTIRV